jgi:hypothetical protein
MATSVVFLKSIGEVTLFRNRRSKKIKISVRPDKSIFVSFPYYVSEKEVLSVIAKSESRIRSHIQQIGEKQFLISEGLVLNTKFHKICFCKGDNDDIQIKGKTLEVTFRDFDSDRSRDMADHLITRVYRVEARNILPRRLRELAEKYGFSYNKVTVRNNKCNWGSCSSGNNISLNLQMMKLPDELIDYILLHELVHTQVKDHSSRFWERLDRVTGGNAKGLAKEVKKYSTYSF